MFDILFYLCISYYQHCLLLVIDLKTNLKTLTSEKKSDN